MTIADRAKIAIALPQAFPDGYVDTGLIRRWVARAEELGYESLWTQERMTSRSAMLEPLHLLTYAAALSTRVRLGVAVLVMTRHVPVQLAVRIATLDQLSGGRIIVGIGVGGASPRGEAMGLPADRAVRRLTEGLAVMKVLWTQPAADYQGQLWQLENTSIEPKPAQKPHPPVWFGAVQPDAVRRAVRLGDGWMGQGGGVSIDDFKQQAALVRECLDEAGRDPSSFAISKRLYLAVDDDEARAERRIREWYGAYYGNPDRASLSAVWGNAAHCAERIEELVEAGANHVLLHPVFDHMEHLESLAELTGLRS